MVVDPQLGSPSAAERAALSAWQVNIHPHEGFVHGPVCVGAECERWDPPSVCVCVFSKNRKKDAEHRGQQK